MTLPFNKDELIEKSLKKLCKNANICLDLGEQSELVKQYFDNYDLKSNYIRPGKRIGAPSANGVVIEVPFKKKGYKSYTAFKMACTNESDNLMYEYQIGKTFINNYIKIYPCFTETYGLYKLDSADHLDIITKATNKQPIYMNVYTNSILSQPVDWKIACNNPKYYCILIQYFPDFKTIFDDASNKFSNVGINIITILYQYYFVLDKMSSIYTHYDFHVGNAGYYEPFSNGYIIMNYHNPDNTTTTFPTQYISKIIDYGRSYFPDHKQIMNELRMKLIRQNVPLTKLGTFLADTGFSVIKGLNSEKASSKTSIFYWINPNYPNCSHDLRALNSIIILLTKLGYHIADGIAYDEKYGTREFPMSEPIVDNNGNPMPGKIITNVTNAELYLREFINNNIDAIRQQMDDKGLQLIGEMHIYSDGRPYEFILK